MFWNYDFYVICDILDLCLEIELLVEVVLVEFFESVLDMGMGIGVILILFLVE